MKIECVKEKFRTTLTLLDRIVGKGLSVPLLSYIFCYTTKNSIILRATNLDIGVEVEVPSKIISNGECLIPTQLISSSLSNIQFENISFSSNGDKLFITTPKHNILIKGAEITEEFPKLPVLEKGVTVEIDTRQLINGIKSVLYAAALSEIKPEIASVYIYTTSNTIVFVSTDGFRLAEKKLTTNQKDEIRAILPYKNAIEIVRLLESSSGETTSIIITTTQCVLVCGTMTISSRLVDGIYPDYPQLIPSSFITEVSVLKDEILSALKVSHVFCDSSNQLMIGVHPTDSHFEVGARNNSVGENTISLDATMKGEDVDVFYNIRYINDLFQSITTPRLFLGFNTKSKPMVIRGEGDSSFTYLVMPVNR